MSKSRLKYILLLIMLIFILLSKAVFFEFYRISSGSMMQTIYPGDFLIVNKLTYGARTPNIIHIPFINFEFNIPSFRFPASKKIEQNDIIVIKGDYPSFENNFVKRIAAVEGQTIVSYNGMFFVDNVLIENRNPNIEIELENNPELFGPFTVPEGKVFVLGDNINNSYDSRHFGYVDKDDIIGKVWFIYASFDDNGNPRWDRFFQKVE